MCGCWALEGTKNGFDVDARQPREFDQDAIEFLKTYAMVLGPVIDRLKTVAALRRTDEGLRLIVDNASAYVMVATTLTIRLPTGWVVFKTFWVGLPQRWSASRAM